MLAHEREQVAPCGRDQARMAALRPATASETAPRQAV